MKTIFARVLILWFIAGQIFYVCLPQFVSRPPTELEKRSVHDQSPNIRTALEHELDRAVEYESKRAIGIVMLLLALDGLLIGCFWNSGSKGKRTRAQSEN